MPKPSKGSQMRNWKTKPLIFVLSISFFMSFTRKIPMMQVFHPIWRASGTSGSGYAPKKNVAWSPSCLKSGRRARRVFAHVFFIIYRASQIISCTRALIVLILIFFLEKACLLYWLYTINKYHSCIPLAEH